MPVSLWQKAKDICESIDRKYDPENDLGTPAVTWTDMQLKDAVWQMACFCQALSERLQELESREQARAQNEEMQELRY